MKKVLSLVISALMLFTLVACGDDDENPSVNLRDLDLTAEERAELQQDLDELQREEAGNNPSGGSSNPSPSGNDPVLDLPLVIENYTTAYNLAILENGDAVKIVPNWGSKEYETVLTDVRAVYSSSQTSYYLIKNDNSLWAYGSNQDGKLGDNTGVDQNEPVKIMDNVANIYVHGSVGSTIYAVTMDKALWVWGRDPFVASNAIYAPIQLMEDVVAVCGNGYAIKSDGTLWTWANYHYFNGYAFTTQNTEPMYVMGDVMSFCRGGYMESIYGVLRGDNSFWAWTSEYNNRSYTETPFVKLLDDVMSINSVGIHEGVIFAIKADNSLWGMGNNSSGYLGDGSKIDRDELVKIMDDVLQVFEYTILKTDGTIWHWTTNNPTPEMFIDNVIAYQYNYHSEYLTTDGALFEKLGSSTTTLKIEGVRMPSREVVG